MLAWTRQYTSTVYLRISTHIYAYLRISTHIYAYLRISIHIYAYLRISTHIYNPPATCKSAGLRNPPHRTETLSPKPPLYLLLRAAITFNHAEACFPESAGLRRAPHHLLASPPQPPLFALASLYHLQSR